DHGALAGQVEDASCVVRMAVVPGHELGRRPRPRQVLTRDAETPIRLRSYRVRNGVVVVLQLRGSHVAAHLDVPEEAEAGSGRDLLERARDRLDVRVVRGDAEADEPPGRRKPLDHVDLRGDSGVQQVTGGVEGCRPGSDYGDAERSAGAVRHGASVVI